ncbi:MAG: WYL domain-containing protein [Thermoanaerobaculia bacterium]|nr:WYL domain-containing protein [Thermoanaerobaculia bacterium]
MIRKAAKAKRRLEIDYVNEDGKKSRRVINPLGLRIYPPWVVIAWCEERENVRMFRVDRMKRIGPIGLVSDP